MIRGGPLQVKSKQQLVRFPQFPALLGERYRFYELGYLDLLGSVHLLYELLELVCFVHVFRVFQLLDIQMAMLLEHTQKIHDGSQLAAVTGNFRQDLIFFGGCAFDFLRKLHQRKRPGIDRLRQKRRSQLGPTLKAAEERISVILPNIPLVL